MTNERGSDNVSNLNRRLMSLIAGGTAAVAMLIPAASAGADPVATKSGEELVSYVTTTPKLPLSRHIAFQLACGQDCLLSATTELKLKGPDIGPVTVSGQFTAGTIAEAFIDISKTAKNVVKANKKSAKLVTEVTGTNPTTGEIDTDTFTFKFK